jgi:hypothetical protein
MTEDLKVLAARRWFGYGSWDAPYWFIGKEPGGTPDPSDYASWQHLGGMAGAELIDCREHDIDCDSATTPMRWHCEHIELQATWRPLIALLLAYQGAVDYDREAVRRYQDKRWGRIDAENETAVIELSAIAARDTSVPEPLRLAHVDERIATIQRNIATHRPRFVVFHGAGYDPVFSQPYLYYWSKIAGVPLEQGTISHVDGIAYLAISHAHGVPTSAWMQLGRALRACSNSTP